VTETVTITGLGHSGDGIAEGSDGPIYVPLTLPGEKVAIDRQGNRGRVLEILAASPDRVRPLCRHFGECGTCALEHMSPSAYLAWKRGLVVSAFRQRGLDPPVEAIVPIAPGSRRRAVFSALNTGREVLLGYHRRGTHDIVSLTECAVLVPAIVGKLHMLRQLARLVLRPGKPARVTVLAADNGLDIAIADAAKPNRATLEALARFAGDAEIARLTVDGSDILVARRPELKAGNATLFPVPGGFVQAAGPAENAMAAAVLAHVGEAGSVADLFAGIGTFSLRLAAHARVTAVEGDAALLAALAEATRFSRGIKPVTTRKRDLFLNPLSPPELDAFDAVVFDPPSGGAKSQSEALARSSVATIVAVSCNPATLARDARILVDGGYRLTTVLPVDQFLFSAEVEAVAAFRR